MKHIIDIFDAPKIWEWLNTRGGIAVWSSINLSNPGAGWTTPATHADGKPATKPNWQAANEPDRIITNAEDILVQKYEECKRFHVAVRRSSNGLMVKCTDASSERIRKAVSKAGEGATYVFDYETQDAVILKPVDSFDLLTWHKYFQEGRPCENS